MPLATRRLAYGELRGGGSVGTCSTITLPRRPVAPKTMTASSRGVGAVLAGAGSTAPAAEESLDAALEVNQATEPSSAAAEREHETQSGPGFG